MNYKEAIEYSLTVKWKTTPCSSGEECWCRIIEPEQEIKDNAGNVSYKNFSLSPVAVSTETDCYVLYPTLQSAIGTASSNSDLRKWNSFWNSYIIKKC